MAIRRSFALIAMAAFIGCEQQNQTLPFSTDVEEEVRRTIDGASGGKLSSPAGATVDFPPGSLPSSTDVSVQRVAGTDVGAPVGGRVLDGSVFRIEPAGTALNEEASVDVRVGGVESLSPREQLSLSTVLVSDGQATKLNTPTIDLTSGIVRSRIDRLGTVATRVADDLLTLEAGDTGGGMSGGSLYGAAGGADGAATAGTTRSTFVIDCSGAECLEVIDVIAGQSMVDRFGDRLGAVDLDLSVTLTFERSLVSENTGVVDGSLDGSLAVRLRSAGSVASMPYDFSLDAPAGTRYEIDGNRINFAGETLYYRVFDENGTRYLELELPATEVELDRAGGSELVHVAGRVRLEQID